MIQGVFQVISKKEGLSAVKRSLLEQIEKYDYLGTYNYAYMLNKLDLQDISDGIACRTVERLEQHLRSCNPQNSLLLSRFFGEMYKYDLIKRSYLYDSLERFLAI